MSGGDVTFKKSKSIEGPDQYGHYTAGLDVDDGLLLTLNAIIARSRTPEKAESLRDEVYDALTRAAEPPVDGLQSSGPVGGEAHPPAVRPGDGGPAGVFYAKQGQWIDCRFNGGSSTAGWYVGPRDRPGLCKGPFATEDEAKAASGIVQADEFWEKFCQDFNANRCPWCEGRGRVGLFACNACGATGQRSSPLSRPNGDTP